MSIWKLLCTEQLLTNPVFIWIDPWPTSGVLSEREQPWVTDNVAVHVRSQSLLWPEHCFSGSIFKFVKFSPFEMIEVYHLQYSVVTILLNKSLYGTVQSTNLEWVREWLLFNVNFSTLSWREQVTTNLEWVREWLLLNVNFSTLSWREQVTTNLEQYDLILLQ